MFNCTAVVHERPELYVGRDRACREEARIIPAALLEETYFGSSRRVGRCDPASPHTPREEERVKQGGGNEAGQSTRACVIHTILSHPRQLMNQSIYVDLKLPL